MDKWIRDRYDSGLAVWIFRRSADALQKKLSTPISSMSAFDRSKKLRIPLTKIGGGGLKTSS